MLGLVIRQVGEVQTLTGHADLIARLFLEGDLPGGAPETLIAKVYGPEWYASGGLLELQFYQDFLRRTPALPVPQLLGFENDLAARRCTLLLEDLGAAYQPVALPPPPALLEHLTRVLAAFHAAWWNAPELESLGFRQPDTGVTRMPQALDPAGLAAHAQAARQAAASFLDNHELSAGERALLERLMDRWPGVFQQRVEGGHLTLIHGDLHLLGNVFQSADALELRLIDWAQIKRGLGPHDLMYMLISADAPDRLERDTALIQRYHASLVSAGVVGYALEQCLDDYRLSLLTNLFQSIFQDSLKWFRKTAALVELWRCAELLTE
ncbi:aminoglycoside phosphotransferase family protein [Deinococcus saxicola]